MLRRMIDPRKPVSSYDDDFVIADEFGNDERIGGRLLAESPSGRALLSLGAFDTDSQVSSVRCAFRLRRAPSASPYTGR